MRPNGADKFSRYNHHQQQQRGNEEWGMCAAAANASGALARTKPRGPSAAALADATFHLSMTPRAEALFRGGAGEYDANQSLDGDDENPRFIHNGRLLRCKGSVFNKLTDPALYTGSARVQFDPQGRGRGMMGRETDNACSALSTGAANPKVAEERWTKGLRHDFYVDPATARRLAVAGSTAAAASVAGSMIGTESYDLQHQQPQRRSVSSRSRSGGAAPAAASYMNDTESTRRRFPASTKELLGRSGKDAPSPPPPRFEAWVMNPEGVLVCDAQRTARMLLGPDAAPVLEVEALAYGPEQSPWRVRSPGGPSPTQQMPTMEFPIRSLYDAGQPFVSARSDIGTDVRPLLRPPSVERTPVYFPSSASAASLAHQPGGSSIPSSHGEEALAKRGIRLEPPEHGARQTPYDGAVGYSPLSLHPSASAWPPGRDVTATIPVPAHDTDDRRGGQAVERNNGTTGRYIAETIGNNLDGSSGPPMTRYLQTPGSTSSNPPAWYSQAMAQQQERGRAWIADPPPPRPRDPPPSVDEIVGVVGRFSQFGAAASSLDSITSVHDRMRATGRGPNQY